MSEAETTDGSFQGGPDTARPPVSPNGLTPAPVELAPPRVSDGFGTMLEPVLLAACGGRLSDVRWFRTTWQRGGALTGYALHTCDDDAEPCPAVVKLPITPGERDWLVRLGPTVAPRVYAHGDALGGYDLAWVVMERLPHGPLGPAWGGREFDLLIDAIGRFYTASSAVPHAGRPAEQNWELLCHRARQATRSGAVAHSQRWNKALKRAGRRVRQWTSIWEDRPRDGWCHGDLHLANAMTRLPAPHGPAVLFDFALTRVGHWLEDAVYFEHLYWARRDRLNGRKLCSGVAHERKKRGLAVHPDWPRLAEIKRALLAMTTPVRLHHDGEPAHVQAALEVLEAAI